MKTKDLNGGAEIAVLSAMTRAFHPLNTEESANVAAMLELLATRSDAELEGAGVVLRELRKVPVERRSAVVAFFTSKHGRRETVEGA